MQNWPTENVPSNLVSETKRSILSLIITLFLTEFMFIWTIITLKGLFFFKTEKVENEIPLKCLSGKWEDIEFSEISQFLKSSSKLLFKLQLLTCFI